MCAFFVLLRQVSLLGDPCHYLTRLHIRPLHYKLKSYEKADEYK